MRFLSLLYINRVMKHLRNYFGESELHHTFNKAWKRKSSNELSEIISNYQKLFSEVKNIKLDYGKIPSNGQIEKLKDHFISKAYKNSFVEKEKNDIILNNIKNDITTSNENVMQSLHDIQNRYVSKKIFEEKWEISESKINIITSSLDDIIFISGDIKKSIEKNIQDIYLLRKKTDEDYIQLKSSIDQHVENEKKKINDLAVRITNTLNSKIMEINKKISGVSKDNIKNESPMKKDITSEEDMEFATSFDMIAGGTEIQPTIVKPFVDYKNMGTNEFRKQYSGSG